MFEYLSITPTDPGLKVLHVCTLAVMVTLLSSTKGCSLTYGRHWKPIIHNTSIDISTNANVHIHAQGHAARR